MLKNFQIWCYTTWPLLSGCTRNTEASPAGPLLNESQFTGLVTSARAKPLRESPGTYLGDYTGELILVRPTRFLKIPHTIPQSSGEDGQPRTGPFALDYRDTPGVDGCHRGRKDLGSDPARTPAACQHLSPRGEGVRVQPP